MIFIYAVLLSSVPLAAQEDESEIIIIRKRIGKKIELIKYNKVILTLKLMLILAFLNLKKCAPKEYPAFAGEKHQLHHEGCNI